ncbi:MAG TPA: hypothetical protein DD000_12840 [Cyanobacteria bacterium UBA11166]|nr:hypothetical protein [Cyanobacteria bacterium UBA11166]
MIVSGAASGGGWGFGSSKGAGWRGAGWGERGWSGCEGVGGSGKRSIASGSRICAIACSCPNARAIAIAIALIPQPLLPILGEGE